MKIKFSDMSGMIAEEIIKVLTPTIRKIIREEVSRGVSKIIKEQQSMSLVQKETANNINEDAKGIIAQRARNRARNILENKLRSDDPYASLILEAEDPQEEINMRAKQQLNKPMIKSAHIDNSNFAMPENIDFSDRLDQLGI